MVTDKPTSISPSCCPTYQSAVILPAIFYYVGFWSDGALQTWPPPPRLTMLPPRRTLQLRLTPTRSPLLDSFVILFHSNPGWRWWLHEQFGYTWTSLRTVKGKMYKEVTIGMNYLDSPKKKERCGQSWAGKGTPTFTLVSQGACPAAHWGPQQRTAPPFSSSLFFKFGLFCIYPLINQYSILGQQVDCGAKQSSSTCVLVQGRRRRTLLRWSPYCMLYTPENCRWCHAALALSICSMSLPVYWHSLLFRPAVPS